MNPAKRALKDRDDQLFYIATVLGLKRYDSARPCDRCNGKERYVSNRGCVICSVARNSGKAAKQRRHAMALTREEARTAGQRYYFPIHRCRHGHKSRWSVRFNECMMCVRKEASRDLHRRLSAAEQHAADLERLPSTAMTEEQILRLAE
jgi:hypothetical protein